MNKSKLLFVYDMPEWKEKFWMDGLWAALNLLEEDFEIEKINLIKANGELSFHVDTKFILGWGGFNSRVDHSIRHLTTKTSTWSKGLCIGGNAFPPTGADNYDVLFYETKWYRPQISFHKNIVHAFGVNTDIYNQPDIPFPIVWDYIGVGAFADWKRWPKMLDKKGNRLVVGEFQENNPVESGWIADKLLRNGVMVSNMVHPFDLANLYHWSRTLYTPADINGGGERAIMEAKSCGLIVEIEEDNPKLKEVLEGPVLSHFDYAKALKKGIMSVI